MQIEKIDWKKGMTGLAGARIKSSTLEAIDTKPPEYYNEGSLIIAMKNVDKGVKEPELKKLLKSADGIGTPATRASIIDALIQRNWVEISKSGMKITEKGRVLLNQIPQESGFRDVATSAYWELHLKAIERSGDDNELEKFMRTMEDATINLVNLLKKQAPFQLPGEAQKLSQDGQVCEKCKTGVLKSLTSNNGGKQFLKCQNQACGAVIFPAEIWGNKDQKKSDSKSKKSFTKFKK